MDALARSTYYQYDIGNRLHAVLDPLNKAAYYGYDANSNLARTLDNNRTAVYFGYDALDRRTAIQYPTETQYFGYDAAGNLVQSRDNWGGSYFGYDTLSRLAQRRTPRQDTVYYGYDGVSNLLRLQYPQDHAACYYGYDDAQRLSQLLSSAGHSCYYTYDASSNVTRRVMGNGVVSYATFDRTDRMLSLRYATSGGAGLAYFDYNRDVAGRILRIQREATAGYAIYYAYDQIDRLEAEVWRKSSDNSQIYGFWYSYDAANNRLQMRRETTAGVTWDSTYYQYAADNALVRRQVATPPSTVVDTYYGYDANGALTQVLEGANATYFGYGANQLVTRILPPSEAATYFSYDGRLNRYYIDKAGTQTYYLWDGLNQLEERDGSGTLKARYNHGNYRQYGIGSVVEIERHVGATTYYQYPLMDHRGTVYAVTDQNQATQLSYTLDAFGRQLAGIGGALPTVPNDLIYQTNWLTLQIGGRQYGISKYRLYDFETGIFLQRDFLPYLNKYRAFSNNPAGQVDRDGLADAFEGIKGNVGGYSSASAVLSVKAYRNEVLWDEITKQMKCGELKVKIGADNAGANVKIGGYLGFTNAWMFDKKRAYERLLEDDEKKGEFRGRIGGGIQLKLDPTKATCDCPCVASDCGWIQLASTGTEDSIAIDVFPDTPGDDFYTKSANERLTKGGNYGTVNLPLYVMGDEPSVEVKKVFYACLFCSDKKTVVARVDWSVEYDANALHPSGASNLEGLAIAKVLAIHEGDPGNLCQRKVADPKTPRGK